MMPFKKNLKGRSQSGDDDRKNVIKQIKVRNLIKGDKSWIHKPDDTEGQTIELPPTQEQSAPEPPPVTTQKERTPPPKASPGYIIRGVFTKPVDSTSLPQTQFPPAETSKSSIIPGKSASSKLPRHMVSGYKVIPDEYNKKIAEAASGQLPRAATWGRSYVLSAAKKNSESSAQDSAPAYMAKRVEITEDEVPSEKSQTLPSLARQFFNFASSDSSRERPSSSSWSGNVSRNLFSTPKVQEYSAKKEETHTLLPQEPKMESSLLDLSSETSQKRTSLEHKERNISSTKEDIPTEEEDKDTYPDEADRPILSYGDHFLSGIHGEDYEGPGKQQPVEVNKPSRPDPHPQEGGIREIPLAPPVPRDYRPSFWNPTRHGSEEHAIFSPEDQFDRSMNLQYCMPGENTTKYSSASTVTTTEKRYGSSVSSDDLLPPETRRFASSTIGSTDQRFGTLPSVDEMLTSDHRSSLSGYEERSVTTIVREARWDKTAHAGAKGDTRPDPNIHYSSYRVITPDSAHQLPLKGSDQEYSSRRYASATGDRPSMGGMPASSRDSASASDSEPPASSAKISGATCTYCCKEIRSGPKITLEHLGICCHEWCFKCGICKKKMGNMLDHVYIHKGIIHCDQCYARLF
ncbi:zinc finger protein 185 isoform X3 [Sarcophilus harrisii]|uniref:zinc finger protein 185 isoform X3 n=1 Tax=Sarcophilus harrisii TaxID=9305 RepID=UPI00022712E4|nr:zinc finger protein 185 isoform X3 [Sarcophilus harrisii]